MVSHWDSLSEETISKIDDFVERWIENKSVPGVSVAVLGQESVLYASGRGARDIESGAPATPDTLYAVASLTKAVTAIAILQLVQRGGLDLDDEIREYVSVLDEVPGAPITVHELLSHSSGMPQDFIAQRDRIDDAQEMGLFEYIDGTADQRLTDKDRYMYYNSGYFILGTLVETVDGRSYAEYVEEEVLAPLGMNRSTFDPDVLRTGEDTMTGYVENDGELVADVFEGGAGAAGGLISSATDLAALLRCVLNDGTLDGVQVLDPELVEAMCKYQSPLLPTADGTRRGYGYGWEVADFLDDTLVSHQGGIGLSGAYMGILRKRGLAVALAFNTHGPPAAILGRGILAIASGEQPRDVVPLLTVYETVGNLTGTYEAYRSAMTVTVEKGPLGTIKVTLPERGVEFMPSPNDLDEDRGKHVFSSTMGSGARWIVEFRENEPNSKMVLSMGKWTTVLSKQ
ncbi:serine hydrolase [Halomarina pelagica]|uniref:serine hydrolase n=1 Tax=Halomarina pelagica TaxID=2961599 RepID=UPI0020C3380B|nr:serine hydrolase [Halomarina sp. BND7]